MLQLSPDPIFQLLSTREHANIIFYDVDDDKFKFKKLYYFLYNTYL